MTPAPSSPVALLDQLDELRAKATPGPWEVDEDWIWAGLSGGGAFGELVSKAVDIEDADAALIVAAVNAVGPLADAVRAVLEVHGAIDAVQYFHSRQVPRRVCTGCGTDDGNWQIWPCPTVRAITAALPVTP